MTRADALRRPAALAALLSMLLLPALSGCSSTPASSDDAAISETAEPLSEGEPAEADADAGPDDAAVCVLLAGQSVEELLAEPAGPPRDSGGVCKIEAAGADSAGSIVLQVVPDGGAATFANQKTLLGVDAEVAALGDEAFQSGKRIDVLSGDRHLYLQVVRDPLNPARQVDDAALLAAAQAVFAATGW